MRRILSEAGLRGEGYNIVLQGDVTNLATMTPHKRRGVLEEVAGVTAYDEEIRKANTQRKHVENNIETIDIFEADQKGRLKELEKEREAGPEIQGTEGRSRPRPTHPRAVKAQEQRRGGLSPNGGESQLCFQGATTLQRDDRVQHDPRRIRPGTRPTR